MTALPEPKLAASALNCGPGQPDGLIESQYFIQKEVPPCCADHNQCKCQDRPHLLLGQHIARAGVCMCVCACVYTQPEPGRDAVKRRLGRLRRLATGDNASHRLLALPRVWTEGPHPGLAVALPWL